MRIYSGGSGILASAAPPPPPLALPLWVVLGRTDLHELFLEFAAQVFNSTGDTNTKADFQFLMRFGFPPITSGLSRMIYDGWLTEFVETTITETPRATSTYPVNIPPPTPAVFSYTKTINYRAVGPAAVPEVTVKTTTVTSPGTIAGTTTVTTYDTTALTVYKRTIGAETVPEVTDAGALISLIQKVLTVRPGCRLYALIGMYHFVIWCLSTKVDSVGRINAGVVAYVHQELKSHRYSAPNAQYDVLWQPTAVPPGFLDAFVQNYSLRQFTLQFQTFVNYLKFDDPTNPNIPSWGVRNPDQKKAVNAGVCSFITRARALLADVVHEEVIALLEVIDVSLARDYKKTKVLAIGNGDETYGFFGIRNFGILFLQYHLDGVPSTADFLTDPEVIKYTETPKLLAYLGVRKVTDFEVDDAFSVFLAPLGMDQSFSDLFGGSKDSTRLKALIPHVDVELLGSYELSRQRVTLYAVENGTCRFETDGTAAIYNSAESSISAGDASCTHLTLATNTNMRGDIPIPSTDPQRLLEELGFFVMPNRVAAAPPTAEAATYWLLPDNEFYDESKIPQLFETSPNLYPDLDAVLAELVFNGEFKVSATLRGDGIGTILDPSETSVSWQNVIKASKQNDLPKSNTKTGENAQERHARGTMSYFQIGGYRLLKFDVVGFASPVRCTWKANYSHYPEMKEKIGDYVKDLDEKGDPWYNGALSSFRAFGLLMAMIKALLERAEAANVTTSSAYIETSLKDFLVQEARVRIPTRAGKWVLKQGNELFIDLSTFKYVTATTWP